MGMPALHGITTIEAAMVCCTLASSNRSTSPAGLVASVSFFETPPIITRIGSAPGTDLQERRLHAADHPPPNAPTNGPVPPIISDKTFRPTPAVP
ncbi:MAG TPA: hypothetical protein VGA37_01175 [Gemmatimonadales bacterium]